MPPSVVSSSMGLGSGIIGRERPLIVGSTAFGQHSFRQPQQQQATSLDSKLNSGAGAVPAVTVTPIPSDVIMTKIPLKRKWTFWHDKFVANATPASYTENLKTVAEADTVQSFWSVYNNTAGPEKLALRCSLHFMHKGVKPLWEDPQNERGGAWNFRIAKASTPVVWRELLMALVGEQFEDTIAPGDEIFGLSVSARWNSDIFQIWNMDSSLKESSAVMDKVIAILANVDSLKDVEIQSPFYKAHKDHDHFNNIYDHRDGLMDAIRDNEILVIIGETGSGKTTQLPRYIIEEFRSMRVGVTQPRQVSYFRLRIRIAAISVAKRVAEEYDCRIGDTVGYTIRFDDTTTSRTRLKYMTDGVLLREATMDPLLERTYPVEILHSRDAAKMGALKATYVSKCVDTVMHILNKEVRPGEVGDVLVFLTGQHEIERACQDLKMAVQDQSSKDSKSVTLDQLQILPLYASLELLDQNTIFGPTARNMRKIIFATNIAQTSVTIPNIRFVVDSGFVKQKMYDPTTGMDALLVVPISQAAATQRSGRAGRTRAGICFRMYSRESYETEMEKETVPEILRTGLTGTVLSLKRLGILDVNGFEFLDRPGEEELQAALRELYLVGGIDRFGQMTDVGHGMITYPVNPLLARALVEAEKIGCLDKVITIVAMLSVEEPFYLPRKEEEQDAAREAHAKFYHPSGDHVTLLNVYEAWRESDYSKDWCHKQYFHLRHLRMAKNIRSQLKDIVDRNSQNDRDTHPHHDSISSSRKDDEEEGRRSSPDRTSDRRGGNNNTRNKRSRDDTTSSSSSSSRSILEAFSQGYGIHLSKKHQHRPMFYHYLASTSSPSAGAAGPSSTLLALHVSPLSALYLDEERSMTKHGRRVARDLEWVVYHEVVYHVKAVMRYVSKVDLRWVQATLDRAKIFDQGLVWLNHERSDLPSLKDEKGNDGGSKTSTHDGGKENDMKESRTGAAAEEGESEEQAKKKARIALVEAARKRALERRQNQ
ncbi:P-loop containing nucleoside triphosphate hydrolase protein [Linnemannia elongata AG-77]|uniref:RNA helicase n=1 Tax=Linnemannia elongata AG-77 TaxID=1314771 RepID=A0A197KD52_9FUNG|nr:P-loop containing nucleoside triphosphate hydrolase protein [Linnemannia elongata AG-77]